MALDEYTRQRIEEENEEKVRDLLIVVYKKLNGNTNVLYEFSCGL